MTRLEGFARSEEGAEQRVVPVAGRVMNIVLSFVAITVLSWFMTQRFLVIRSWARLPFVVWLVFAIYIDSYLFVFTTALLQNALGLNASASICEGAILLCLICYVTTKFIYLFLVEKAYIIRGKMKGRFRSRLYLFNSIGLVTMFIAVVILNFVFRIMRIEDGQCVIGMKRVAMIPLISFDTLVNIYLTIIFLIPLRRLHSFRHMPRSAANIRLRTIAFRTFIGCVCTLISSIVNLSVLMALDGEPGYVCLLCCNADILFSVIVIQWVTSKDNAGTSRVDSLSGSRSRGATQATPPEGPSSARLTSHLPRRVESEDDDDDDDDEASDRMTKVRSSEAATTPGSGVMVTTTIHKESKPSEEVHDLEDFELSMMAHLMGHGGFRGSDQGDPKRTSLAVGGGVQGARDGTRRTVITAGPPVMSYI